MNEMNVRPLYFTHLSLRTRVSPKGYVRCIGRIPTEQGREAEDGGMSGATVVGKKKSSQTQRASLEVPSQLSQGPFGGSARKSTGLQGGAIITWFGEGLARTSEPGDGSVVMARNNFPWLECVGEAERGEAAAERFSRYGKRSAEDGDHSRRTTLSREERTSEDLDSTDEYTHERRAAIPPGEALLHRGKIGLAERIWQRRAGDWTDDLFKVVKGVFEDYIQRFNDMKVEIMDCQGVVACSAFKRGLRPKFMTTWSEETREFIANFTKGWTFVVLEGEALGRQRLRKGELRRLEEKNTEVIPSPGSG
ncbi:hypothetical protein FNV43_RR10901 [Rhamnella rubrinervis]|uniref:Uncharacterized protein n=1 Tax=Rhamnella rubrinervis TaxID=2594499 RepID=A0A8K0H584_9ROSA|nr:hypothetical protein FNV43_RR10901 [Rhamnella rubrinervis]